MRKIVFILAVLLLPCTAYGIILAGVYSGGNGTLAAGTYAPNAATGATATPANKQNTITWTASTVDGTHSAPTQYDILWGTVSGSLGNTISNQTSGYVHSGRTNGTTYYYKIRATNSAGSADTAEFSGVPVVMGPNAPTAVAATAGDTQNTVTWTASTEDGSHTAASQYNLLRSTTSGNETLLTSNVTSPVTDSGLTNGTTYYYKIQAQNSAGTNNSSEVSAAPAAAGGSYTDNFNRADGVLTTPWVAVAGGAFSIPTISGNKIVYNAGNDSWTANTTALTNNQYAQADIAGYTGSNQVSYLLVRQTVQSTLNGYEGGMFLHGDTTYTLDIAKRVNGAYTSLASNSISSATAATYTKQKLTAVGSTITLYMWNGSSWVTGATVTDSSISGGVAGIRVLGSTVSADNFTAGGL